MRRFDWLLRKPKPAKRKRSSERRGPRNTYRPFLEALEDRTLLSTSSTLPLSPPHSNAAFVAAPSVALPAAATTPIVGLGVVGDSLSDEYSTYLLRGYATNWVQLLAQKDGINLGPTGDYAEPRGHGYAYDWAKSGATTTTLLSGGQATGLAAQANTGIVSHAVVMIGQNDFNPLLGTAYLSIYGGFWSSGKISAYADQVVANITTTLQQLTNTPAKVVLSNIVDYGIAPDTRKFYSNPAGRAAVSAVINGIDARLAVLANTYHVPIIDLNGAAQFVTGSPVAPKASATIGGVKITNTTGILPTNEFTLDDHPGTLLSGEMANLVLTAFNLGYGTAAPTFSEAQVVGFAGLTYSGHDTLGFNPSLYVHLPTVTNAATQVVLVGAATTLVSATQSSTTLSTSLVSLTNAVTNNIGSTLVTTIDKVVSLPANTASTNGYVNPKPLVAAATQITTAVKNIANAPLTNSIAIKLISAL